jgi:hypothetical protein
MGTPGVGVSPGAGPSPAPSRAVGAPSCRATVRCRRPPVCRGCGPTRPASARVSRRRHRDATRRLRDGEIVTVVEPQGWCESMQRRRPDDGERCLPPAVRGAHIPGASGGSAASLTCEPQQSRLGLRPDGSSANIRAPSDSPPGLAPDRPGPATSAHGRHRRLLYPCALCRRRLTSRICCARSVVCGPTPSDPNPRPGPRSCCQRG